MTLVLRHGQPLVGRSQCTARQPGDHLCSTQLSDGIGRVEQSRSTGGTRCDAQHCDVISRIRSFLMIGIRGLGPSWPLCPTSLVRCRLGRRDWALRLLRRPRSSSSALPGRLRPRFDECALEVDGFPDLLVAARFDLLDGISRTVMADVTNYQPQTHQFRYKQDSDPEAVRRSPDMAAMAE